MENSLKSIIFRIRNEKDFFSLALDIFRFQSKNNSTYKEYLMRLNIVPSDIRTIEEIPFLPIQFFKSRKIITGNKTSETVFTSSGTTGPETSKHYVTDLSLYEESFLSAFQIFYGDPMKYYLLALLPSYLEREGSSLIYMVDRLVKETNSPYSGFYPDDYNKLLEKLHYLKKRNDRTIILFGVSFALLNLAEKISPDLSESVVMETGGMKGRRKEIIRKELHQILSKKLNLTVIHSEYGMTELLSQAYSKGNGIFQTPPWMKILIRDLYDPFRYVEKGRSGGLNIIDLANLNSCSFIETQDIGKLTNENNFEVLGRFDQSDIRGCNLMID